MFEEPLALFMLVRQPLPVGNVLFMLTRGVRAAGDPAAAVRDGALGQLAVDCAWEPANAVVSAGWTIW